MILKLDKLPDRQPTKITFTAKPELKAALADYAEIYTQTYGEAETVANLIPYMLEAFIATDNGFRRARKALADAPSTTTQTHEDNHGDNRQLHTNSRGLRRHNPNVDDQHKGQIPFEPPQDD